MSFTRFIARSMLAGYFVSDGLKSVTDPGSFIEEADPFASRVAELADRMLPDSIADKVPHDTATFVRIHGLVEIIGASMMATGIGRRIGATMLALAFLPKAIAARPRMKSLTDRNFLSGLALLGAVSLAAMDTQGKPDLRWLAAQRRDEIIKASARMLDTRKSQIAHASSRLVSTVGDHAHDAVKLTKKQARAAAKAASAMMREKIESISGDR